MSGRWGIRRRKLRRGFEHCCRRHDHRECIILLVIEMHKDFGFVYMGVGMEVFTGIYDKYWMRRNYMGVCDMKDDLGFFMKVLL